jgi:hypothetical protein
MAVTSAAPIETRPRMSHFRMAMLSLILFGAQRGVPHLGYTVIFAFAAVYFVFGTVRARRIRKVR